VKAAAELGGDDSASASLPLPCGPEQQQPKLPGQPCVRASAVESRACSPARSRHRQPGARRNHANPFVDKQLALGWPTR
jgi:hypothetical protein